MGSQTLENKKNMRRISINDKDAINTTIASLVNGEVVCYPTDTIYGIGTDVKNESGIEKINTIKRRNSPMTVSYTHLTQPTIYSV